VHKLSFSKDKLKHKGFALIRPELQDKETKRFNLKFQDEARSLNSTS